MKNIFFLLVIASLFLSCEEVVDVDLNTADPKLVIEASINWFKNTPGNEQEIKLSLSAPFFDKTVPPANGAVVNITDSDNNSFDFIEDGNTGIYKNTSFTPVLNKTYILTINYKGDVYKATETFIPVVSLGEVKQKNDGGFTGTDIELKAYYTDPAGIENFYFSEIISDIPKIPNLEVGDDKFTDGNLNFIYYSEEDLKAGDVVTIRNYGVSKQFYEFMFLLLLQGSGEGGGPFGTQPATVRGNCINETNPENFPFGYFRLSEADEIIYIVK